MNRKTRYLQKNILGKWCFYYYVGILAVLIFLSLIFEINIVIYFIFLLLGFGWSLFFFGKKLTIVENIMISSAIAFSMVTSFIAVLSLFPINLTEIIFYVFVVLSVLLFYKTDIFKKENFRWKFEWADLLVILMFFFAFFVKIVPTLGMIVPNLADTITHAYFARLIIDSGEISFFYSPGLHIISAYSTMFGGFTIPLQILYITNFFSAYSGLIVYLFMKKAFNNKKISLLAALFISLGPGLVHFFYNGGKNALVLGIPIIFFFLLASTLVNKTSSTKLSILSSILIFSAFITHYPVALFACIFWFCLFIFNVKKNLKQNLIILGGIIAGFIYLFVKYFLFLIPEISSSAIPVTPAMSIPTDFIPRISRYFISLYEISQTYVFPNYSQFIYVLLVLGLLYFLYKLFTSKERNYKVFALWTIGCCILGLTIQVFSIRDFQIVVETYMLSLFVFLYIFLAFGVSFIFFLISKIKIINQKILLIIFVTTYLIMLFILSNSVYKTYKHIAPLLSVVQEDDLQMFDWIDKNITKESSIITNGYFASSVLVGPSDSGGWLTVFTGNKISAPFWEFSNERTIRNLEKYNKLQEDLNNCEVINYFLENDFEYYFQGAIPIWGILGDPSVLEEKGWELVHTEGRTFLFRIPECE